MIEYKFSVDIVNFFRINYNQYILSTVGKTLEDGEFYSIALLVCVKDEFLHVYMSRKMLNKIDLWLYMARCEMYY